MGMFKLRLGNQEDGNVQGKAGNQEVGNVQGKASNQEDGNVQGKAVIFCEIFASVSIKTFSQYFLNILEFFEVFFI